MRTVNEVSKLSGVSIRTLHYYDETGLLKPAFVDRQTGYRHYDEASLLRMQEILFYRELDFPLKSIREILSAPNYNKELVLQEQKQLLMLKKERLEKLEAAMDRIRGKYGTDAISFGSLHHEKEEDPLP